VTGATRHDVLAREQTAGERTAKAAKAAKNTERTED
jgi:hypothetical protein